MSRHLQASLRYLLVVMLSLIVVACIALPEQKPSPDKVIFSPEQMRQDLVFIDQKIRQIHPNPFSRRDLNSYRKNYFATYNELSWPRNRQRFYRAILPFISELQDTHIQMQTPVTEFQSFDATYGRFPLKVLMVDQQMVVLKDLQELPTIPVGAEITAINDVPLAELMGTLGAYVAAETESGRLRLIQVQLPELLWIHFPDQSIHTVSFLWRGKQFKQALEPNPRPRLLADDKTTSIKSHYGDIAVDSSTTMLWINDFNEDYAQFEDYLDSLFTRLRNEGKNNLILDLRYNQGGITDNIRLLLTYLTPEPIRWAQEARLKVSNAFKAQNNQLVDYTKNKKYSRYLGWLPVEYLNLWQWEILFASEGEMLTTEIEAVESERENFFTGEIVVLSNGYCFSACAALVASLYEANIATVIGEAPGSFVDKQYGYPVDVTLPNTGLTLSIPAMEFILSDSAEAKQSMVPHYRVNRRRIDVLTETDIVFQAALEFFKLQKPVEPLHN